MSGEWQVAEPERPGNGADEKVGRWGSGSEGEGNLEANKDDCGGEVLELVVIKVR